MRHTRIGPDPPFESVDKPVPGWPQRRVPWGEAGAKALKERILNKLYSSRPQWLTDAPAVLDAAGAAVHGWPADISDGEVLRKLLTLNGDTQP